MTKNQPTSRQEPAAAEAPPVVTPGTAPDIAPKAATADEISEVDKQVDAIMRGTAFGDTSTRRSMEKELRERIVDSLRNQKPLRIYLGVDPTAPDLHLGHCVPLRKLALFQELGHQSILLIGDFTGLIGDPSDKDSARPMQAERILAENAKTYQDQAFKLLDPETTEVRYNSEWLAKLNFADVVQLASNFTVAQFIERDTFRKRLDAGDPVYVHEFMYGLMQGYDAVALEADIQIGGTDQTFNLMAGRTLQRVYEQKPQVAITYPILVGTDGQLRMSKSTGNYIGINEPANDQYGKAMSVPDDVLINYFTLGTNLSAADVDGIEQGLQDGSLLPMDAKKRLARAIVEEWHGADEAAAAEAHFASVFSRREVPDDMPEHALTFDGDHVTIALPDLLTAAGVVDSKAEVKRLVSQGAIRVDDAPVDSIEVTLAPGAIIKVGKRRWLRIISGE